MKRVLMWVMSRMFPLDKRAPGWKSVAMSLSNATEKGDWR